MRDEEINVGDKLRIRQWDDMINDPNVYKEDDVYVLSEAKRMYLSPKMRFLCGKPFTISDIISVRGSVLYYLSKEGYEEIDERSWYCITSEMLEPCEETELEVADDNDIRLLLA